MTIVALSYPHTARAGSCSKQSSLSLDGGHGENEPHSVGASTQPSHAPQLCLGSTVKDKPQPSSLLHALSAL
eukprot:4783157-Amphidinium_carterae.1